MIAEVLRKCEPPMAAQPQFLGKSYCCSEDGVAARGLEYRGKAICRGMRHSPRRGPRPAHAGTASSPDLDSAIRARHDTVRGLLMSALNARLNDHSPRSALPRPMRPTADSARSHIELASKMRSGDQTTRVISLFIGRLQRF